MQRHSGTLHVGELPGQRSGASPTSPPASRWTRSPRREEQGTHWLLHFQPPMAAGDCGTVFHVSFTNPTNCFGARGRVSGGLWFIVSETQQSSQHQRRFNNWAVASSLFFFYWSYLRNTVAIPRACWIIQEVHITPCCTESFMRLMLPMVSGRTWTVSAGVECWPMSSRFKRKEPEAVPWAGCRAAVTACRELEEMRMKMRGNTDTPVLRQWPYFLQVVQ